MIAKLGLLALAGALGTLARYGTVVFVERHATGAFPWPVFTVNMIGCFLFGFVFAVAEQRAGWSVDTRLIVLTGFMGAFTTFSAFAHNSESLLRESQWVLAASNIVAQNVLGVLLLMAGVAAGKLL